MPNMTVDQPFSPRAKLIILLKRGFIKKRSGFSKMTNLAPSFLIRLIQYVKKFPALLALLIQLFASVFVLIFCWLLVNMRVYIPVDTISIPMIFIVGLQATFASSISRFFNMASWWCWIHFIFPIAVWAMLMFDVPNEVYLAGFLVTLSIFWTSFRTQVPYYPSRVDVWRQMSHITEQYQAKQSTPIRMIDIGSGLGGLSLYLAKHHNNSAIEGIEIAPLPWLVSRLRAMLQRSHAIFTIGDYRALNFTDYDIVFAYLSPAAMTALWEKASKEMRSGTLLISLEFEIPHLTPAQRITQKGQSRALFVYKIA